MEKKPTKKKSNFLGFRLSEQTLDQLDLVAKQSSKTRGIVAKEAIKQWIMLEIFNQTNELISITKTFLIKLLSSAKVGYFDSIIEEIAPIYADLMRFLVKTPMNEDSLKKYSKFTTRFFGKPGLKWFNTIDIQIQNNHLIFRGLHDLEENFSIYFSDFYKYILENHFDLEIIEQNRDLSSQLVLLEYKLQSDK